MHSVEISEGSVVARIGEQRFRARTEPFDSFWEGPDDVEKGFRNFVEFYRYNYLGALPSDRSARVLVISCGPGYFLEMLRQAGYEHVIGIDSAEEKIVPGRARGLDCRAERAVPFLEAHPAGFDAIVCEQELNHLTKDEMVAFLHLCRAGLRPGGRLVVHGLNGANPITGAECLAQNFDHFNSFTEYSLRQVLEHAGFGDVRVFGLQLYVFWRNPANYIGLALTSGLESLFRLLFRLYGKTNRVFSKKVAAVAVRD